MFEELKKERYLLNRKEIEKHEKNKFYIFNIIVIPRMWKECPKRLGKYNCRLSTTG